MYTKRASILTPKSLATLRKVCSPRENASNCFKIVTFFRRNHGSANGLADLENPNFGNAQNPRSQNYPGSENGYPNRGVAGNGNHYGGTYDGSEFQVSSNVYHQSYNGVYGESHRYSSFGGQNGNFGGVNWQGDGDFRRNSNGFNQNYNGVNVERLGNGGFSSAAGQNGNFSGHYSQTNGGFDQRRLHKDMDGPREVHGNVQSSASPYLAGPVEMRERNHDGNNVERLSNGSFSGTSGTTGSFSGYYGQNNGRFDQHRTDMNMNGMLEGNVNVQSSYVERLNDGSVSSSSGQYRNLSGYYDQHNGGFNQGHLGMNMNSQCEGNGTVQSSYSSYTGGPAEIRQQNLGGFVSQGTPQFQGNPSGSYTESPGQFQQRVSTSYDGNIRTCEQRPGYEWHQQSYLPNSKDFNNPMAVTQVPTYPNPEGTSDVVPGSSVCRDPLAELDDFCNEGKVKEAVELLKSLAEQKTAVDLPRFLKLMQVCGEAEALEEAKAVHEDILRSQPNLTVKTYNKILEMYSRCGSMEDAITVFRNMPEQNLTTWDTMITWLAKNGHGEDAIDLFTEFKKAGLKPDGHMFIGVFHACSVVGDVDEGMSHFESMRKDFGIVPTMDHYESIVDMLGSIGYLDEALEFIEKIPLEPSVGVWETLMNLCRIHGNTELGNRCAELVEQLEPSRLNEQSKAGLVPVNSSDLSKENAKKKARNPLEVRSRVHEYRAGDTSHPENDRIYANLRSLREHMKEVGYIPETRFVLHDIDQESKEEALLSHSERLAVGYSLISTPARSPVRIIKNLRACGDCHTALKIISKIVGRELIIRDAKRFHHFKDGSCSCRDYW